MTQPVPGTHKDLDKEWDKQMHDDSELLEFLAILKDCPHDWEPIEHPLLRDDL